MPRVVVTRPAAQAGPLCDALRAVGALPVPIPLIEIVPVAATADACDFDVVIYVSRNAVECFNPTGPSGCAVTIALGPATATALQAHGLAPDVVADPAGGSEALLAHERLSASAVAAGRILIVKGVGGRAVLRETLAARGAEVVELDAYRRAPAARAVACLSQCFEDGPVDAVVLTSVEIARAWLDHLPAAARAAVLADTRHVVLSERIAAVLREAGAHRVNVSRSTDAAALAAELVADS